MTTESIAHASLKVRQLAEHTWMAACSCGEHWDAETKKAANKLRNKHIHRIAVARRVKGGVS